MQKILKLALPMEIGRKNTRQIDAKIKKLALQCKDLKDLHCQRKNSKNLTCQCKKYKKFALPMKIGGKKLVKSMQKIEICIANAKI